MCVAGRVQRLALGGEQLVGRAILAGGFHEDEGAVVGDEMLAEECFGGSPMASDGGPDARPAHFAARTGESVDRALRVLGARSVDAGVDSHPIAHHGHLAEGNAGLGHAVGAGIHAQEDHSFGAVPETAEVFPVAPRGVTEGVVHVGHGSAKGHRVDRVAERASSA